MALQTKDPSTAVISSVGTAVSGGTTSSTKPVITGKADAGNIVVVYDGIRPIGSVIADANGNWTITPAVDLKTGAHNFAAIAHDTANNFGASSAVVNVTITSTAIAQPAAPTLTNDSGLPIVAGSTTNDPHPKVNGTGTAGDIIKVLDNGVVIGSTTIGSDGKWTFKPSPDLNPGPHDFTVIETNPAGTASSPASNPTHITIDTSTPAKPAAPTVTDDSGATIPAGSTTADALPHIDGKGTPGDIIKVLDNGNVIGSTTVKPDGNWSFTPTTGLNDGPHDITVIDTNPAGTSSPASDPTHITIDTSVPAKPATPVLTDASDAVIPAGSTTSDGHPHISGTGKTGDTITVYDGTKAIGSTTVQPDGKWTFTPATDLSTGAHSISVTETNAAGTSSPKSDAVPFTYSLVSGAPVIESVVDAVGTITGPIVNGGVTDDSHPTISGKGVPGYTVYIFQNGTGCGDATVDATGRWTVTLKGALSDGEHVMTATQFTGSGAQSVVSNAWTITVDTSTPAKPPVPILTDESNAVIPAGSTTSDGHPHISGTGKAGDIITVYDGSNVIGSAKIGSDGKWTFTPSSDVSQGTHNISVTDTNPAGTTGPRSDAIAFTFSLVPAAPAITGVAYGEASWTWASDMSPGDTVQYSYERIGGTGPANSVLYLYDGATLIGSTTTSSGGSWVTGILNFSNGTHDLSATVKSAGGVESAHSNHWTFTVGAASVPATPATPVLTDESNAVIPAGSTTADTHPHISGTGTAGDIIKVYDNGSIIGSTTIGSDGKWTYTPSSDMSSGAHSITVTESNAAGMSPTSGAAPFTIGTAVPAAITITGVYDHNHALIPDHGANTGTFTVEGTATGYANGDIVSLYFTGSALGDLSYIRPQIYNIQIVDGKFSVVLTADTKTGVTGTGGALFSGSAGDIVMTAVLQSSAYSNKAGSNNYTITETSWGASVPAAPVIIVLMADEAAWTNPDYFQQSGGTTSHTSEKFTGTGVAGTVVKLYDGATLIGSTTVAQNGIWISNVMTFSKGTHDISATTVSGGVESAHSNYWTFTVNTTPVVVVPTETVTISGLYDDTSGTQVLVSNGGSTKDTTPIVKGDVSHALLSGESLAVYRDGTKVGTATMNGTSWSFNDSGVGVGSHTYTARVENSAGNSAFSGGYSFTEASTAATYTISPAKFDMTHHTSDNMNIPLLTRYFTAYCESTGIVNNATGTMISPYSIAVEVYDQYGNYKFNAGGSPYSPSASTFNPSWIYAFVFRPTDGGAPIFLDVRDGNSYNSLALQWATAGYIYYNADTSMASMLKSPYGVRSTLLSATHQDAGTEEALAATLPGASETTSQHTVVSEHEGFKGTSGHDTVDLNADPTSYFKEATAHIEGSTAHPATAVIDSTVAGGAVPAVNTLHLTGDHQILDLTSLTGKTAAAKISGIEAIDLGGQHNTLKLSLVDVLNLGETDLFMKDGKQQMMVNGKEGDEVDLSNSHIAGLAEGEWQAHGTTEVGGVTYNVYEHSGVHTELLVQQGVQIVVH